MSAVPPGTYALLTQQIPWGVIRKENKVLHGALARAFKDFELYLRKKEVEQEVGEADRWYIENADKLEQEEEVAVRGAVAEYKMRCVKAKEKEKSAWTHQRILLARGVVQRRRSEETQARESAYEKTRVLAVLRGEMEAENTSAIEAKTRIEQDLERLVSERAEIDTSTVAGKQRHLEVSGEILKTHQRAAEEEKTFAERIQKINEQLAESALTFSESSAIRAVTATRWLNTVESAKKKKTTLSIQTPPQHVYHEHHKNTVLREKKRQKKLKDLSKTLSTSPRASPKFTQASEAVRDITLQRDVDPDGARFLNALKAFREEKCTTKTQLYVKHAMERVPPANRAFPKGVVLTPKSKKNRRLFVMYYKPVRNQKEATEVERDDGSMKVLECSKRLRELPKRYQEWLGGGEVVEGVTTKKFTTVEEAAVNKHIEADVEGRRRRHAAELRKFAPKKRGPVPSKLPDTLKRTIDRNYTEALKHHYGRHAELIATHMPSLSPPAPRLTTASALAESNHRLYYNRKGDAAKTKSKVYKRYVTETNPSFPKLSEAERRKIFGRLSN